MLSPIASDCIIVWPKKGKKPILLKLSILSYSRGNGGISEYINVLVERFRSEYDVVALVYPSACAIPDDGSKVLIEYAWNLASGDQLLLDVSTLASAKDIDGSPSHEVYVEVHDKIRGNKTRQIENFATLIYRSQETAKRNNARRFLVVPHISYLNIPKLEPYKGSEVKIGWFGFPGKKKRMLEIAKFAWRLKARAKFVASTSTEETPASREICHAYVQELRNYAKGHPEIEVKEVGFIPLSEIVLQMSDCSHIVFAHRNSDGNSGSMMLAKRMNRPIISTDTAQARLAGIYTTSIISKGFAFGDAIKVLGYHILKEHKFYPSDFREILNALFCKPTTLEEILRVRSNTFYDGKRPVRSEDSSEEDSLHYLAASIFANSTATRIPSGPQR